MFYFLDLITLPSKCTKQETSYRVNMNFPLILETQPHMNNQVGKTDQKPLKFS